ncbi:MAG: hypothetical protein ABIM99_02805 [Candidatus Dojkabacteria bacterium]
MILYKKLLKILTTISILPLFITIKMDPDMWWHLRLGKEILEKNAFINNLTYTCSTYTWINHSWLSDVLMYWIQKTFGLIGISFVFFLITLVGVYFNYKTFEYFLKQQKVRVNLIKRLFFMVISYVILIGFLAIRPQIISFVFISILFNRLIKIYYETLNKKDILGLIILFILWPNLHGGFAIGYALIGFFIVAAIGKLVVYLFNHAEGKDIKKYAIEVRKFVILLLITLPLSLLNPFGLNAWQEVLNNLLNSQNSAYISEWASVNLKQEYGLMIFLMFTAILVLMILNKRVNYLKIALILSFGIFSLSTVRYILVAAPILSILFCLEFLYFYTNFKKEILQDDISKYLKTMFTVIPYLLMLLIISGALVNSITWFKTLHNNETQYDTYPYEAVKFLNEHPEYSKLRILNDYGWGGYLSWVMQDKKWFIDGRMAVWDCEKDSQGSILKDYVEIENLNKNWKEVLNHYNIEVVLMKSSSRLVNVLRQESDWKIVFENNTEVILVKE